MRVEAHGTALDYLMHLPVPPVLAESDDLRSRHGCPRLVRLRMVRFGTLVGSNIFNVLAIMGAAAVASPESIPVSDRSLFLDLPVMVVASLALVVFARLRRPVRRRTGVIFGVVYIAYVGALYAIG
jgi:Ca2+/Na+ antiporter